MRNTVTHSTRPWQPHPINCAPTDAVTKRLSCVTWHTHLSILVHMSLARLEHSHHQFYQRGFTNTVRTDNCTKKDETQTRNPSLYIRTNARTDANGKEQSYCKVTLPRNRSRHIRINAPMKESGVIDHYPAEVLRSPFSLLGSMVGALHVNSFLFLSTMTSSLRAFFSFFLSLFSAIKDLSMNSNQGKWSWQRVWEHTVLILQTYCKYILVHTTEFKNTCQIGFHHLTRKRKIAHDSPPTRVSIDTVKSMSFKMILSFL